MSVPSSISPGVRCAVYIDGLNLYNSALSDPAVRWLDVAAFAKRLAFPNPVESVSYVTGRLNPDDSSNRDSPTRQLLYLKALSARGGVEVTAHNFVVQTSPRVVSRGKSWHDRTDPPLPIDLAARLDEVDAETEKERRINVRLPEEKMTDVALAVAMVNDFHLNRCDQTILVANDSDYRPALIALAELDHDVLVVSPGRSTAKLLRDDRWRSTTLDQGILAQCQLPDEFVANGKTFERPAYWLKTTEARS